jgi:hypothetical protein
VASQKEVCEKFKADFIPCSEAEKFGLAIETLGKFPVNGLRHKSENGTCGWYIWCGEELSQETDFFKPLHVSHIKEYLPEIEQYLALPPGYRFLIADGYEDVWHDSSLTNM